MLTKVIRKVGRSANKILHRSGFEIRPVDRHTWEDQESYIPLEATLKAAKEAGLSVGDYIDTIINKSPGATQATIDALEKRGVFENKIGTILEIGPGSGRYLEKVMRLCTPSRYEIYETAMPWAQYLVRTYGVTFRSTSGYSLEETPSASVDLVHAHKVFNSINFMPTCCLWTEMARVTKAGGYCVFDIMTERCLDAATIATWAKSEIRAGSYPTAMPRSTAIGYFEHADFQIVDSFIGPLGPGTTEVFIFRKRQAGVCAG